MDATPVLCDTNVLIRVSKPDHEQHQLALDAVSTLHATGRVPAIVPQGCYEYYVVATRPVEQNGIGLTPTAAIGNIEELLTLFRLMRDERSIFGRWMELVEQHGVKGKQAHDARIVAAMQRHGIDQQSR